MKKFQSGENSIIASNEAQANIFVAKAMRITALVLTLIMILNIVGIFIIDMNAMVVAYISGMVLLLTPTLLVNVLKIKHPALKYIFVSISALFVCIMIVTLNWHAVVIYIFAIGVAGMYFSKGVNIYAIVLSPIAFSIAQYFAYKLNLTTDSNIKDMYHLIVFVIAPRALSLVAVSSLFLSLNNRTRLLLENLMDVDAQAKMAERMRAMREKSVAVSDTLLSTVDTLSTVSQNTTANNETIVEIAGIAMSASEETQQQLREVGTNVSMISENLSKLAEGTSEITNLSNDVHELTEANLSNMQMVLEGFDGITRSTVKSREAINTLQEKSREIAGITKVITDISMQTNILSLNASIESARAGAAGKGFAVVAEEIRNLAQQTQEAVENISVIIEDVVQNTLNAAQAMDESTELVNSGMDYIKAAGESSRTVTEATDSMTAKIGGIDLLTRDVANYSEKIVTIVDGVGEISEQSMEELKRVGDACEEERNNIKILVDLVVGIDSISRQLEEVLNDK